MTVIKVLLPGISVEDHRAVFCVLWLTTHTHTHTHIVFFMRIVTISFSIITVIARSVGWSIIGHMPVKATSLHISERYPNLFRMPNGFHIFSRTIYCQVGFNAHDGHLSASASIYQCDMGKGALETLSVSASLASTLVRSCLSV